MNRRHFLQTSAFSTAALALGQARAAVPGLMIGIDFVKNRATREPDKLFVHNVELRAFQKGLLTLSCGASTLRLAPPLTIDKDDVKIALEILEDVIRDLHD